MHRYRRIILYSWWLIPLLWMTLSASYGATTPSNIMSKAMIAMMDTMGELAHRFKGDTDWNFDIHSSPSSSWYGWGGSPWGKPGWYYPGYGSSPQALYPYTYSTPGGGPPIPPPMNSAAHKSLVDGIWIGQGGEIVLVMYGHFRIYANAKYYRDGRFRIVGNKLFMLDPETDLIQKYDYVLDNGMMVLRSESGTFFYFKQLPIPIPPYTLIHGIN